MKIYVLFFLCCSIPCCAQETEGIKKINGTSLYLSVKGKGENLVVLHGGPGLNHSYFKPHLAGLEKKFSVIYYDQRACGQSSTPSADSLSIHLLVEDLEAIRKLLGINKLNLLAHSWGAVLATHYANAYPTHVNIIIYSNPAMLSREYDQEAAELSMKKVIKEDSVKRADILAGGNLTVHQYEQLMHFSFRTSAYDRKNMNKLNLNLPSGFLDANKALFGGLMKDPLQKANLYDSLRSFNFPVLIIHGEADIIPLTSIERMKNNLPKPTLEIFQYSGHFPFVEEPEKYSGVITAFLKKHPGK
jgi:proline iminopeptidase